MVQLKLEQYTTSTRVPTLSFHSDQRQLPPFLQIAVITVRQTHSVSTAQDLWDHCAILHYYTYINTAIKSCPKRLWDSYSHRREATISYIPIMLFVIDRCPQELYSHFQARVLEVLPNRVYIPRASAKKLARRVTNPFGSALCSASARACSQGTDCQRGAVRCIAVHRRDPLQDKTEQEQAPLLPQSMQRRYGTIESPCGYYSTTFLATYMPGWLVQAHRDDVVRVVTKDTSQCGGGHNPRRQSACRKLSNVAGPVRARQPEGRVWTGQPESGLNVLLQHQRALDFIRYSSSFLMSDSLFPGNAAMSSRVQEEKK
ncbi:hypothetical protein DFH11DRAFT_1543075 [Phellopilus nigrolimitatus]|nr:hypothetical protein DFH11DRAFT_1543075 [Phellopilus nigrolimitatus]